MSKLILRTLCSSYVWVCYIYDSILLEELRLIFAEFTEVILRLKGTLSIIVV